MKKRSNKKITIYVDDRENSLEELLNYIKTNGNTGHSFSIVVDPDDEREKKFGWDGDGGDFIEDIEIEKIESIKHKLKEQKQMQNERIKLKEFKTRPELKAKNKEHLMFDSEEVSLEEDVTMTEDDIIKKPEVVKQLDDKDIDVSLTDKKLGEAKKQRIDIGAGEKQTQKYLHTCDECDETWESNNVSSRCTNCKKLSKSGVKKESKKQVKENIQDIFQWFAERWNDTSTWSDTWGDSQITKGEAFRLTTALILGLPTTIMIAANWDKVKNKLAKAKDKFKKLVSAGKKIKTSTSKEDAESKLGVSLNEAILAKRHRINKIINLIEKYTNKKVVLKEYPKDSENMSAETKQIIGLIPYIEDVDYTPEPKEVYEQLPEPYRTRALKALDYRNKNFKQLSAKKLKQYESKKRVKNNLKESNLTYDIERVNSSIAQAINTLDKIQKRIKERRFNKTKELLLKASITLQGLM